MRIERRKIERIKRKEKTKRTLGRKRRKRKDKSRMWSKCGMIRERSGLELEKKMEEDI